MAASTLGNLLSFLFPSLAQSQTKTPPPNQAIPTTVPLSSDSCPTLSASRSSRNTGNRDGLLLVQDCESGGCSSTFPKDLMSVVFPSMAYSNTLFFKSAYNVQVIVGEDEPEEALLRRFRREVMKAGVIQECKRRRFFENKQEEKKRKTREAARRNKRRSRRTFNKTPQVEKQETTKKASEDEDDDNWDLPEQDPFPN